MKLKTILPALIALGTLTSTLAFAASPAGTFTYHFNRSNTPLWDLSGPLALHNAIQAAAGETIPVDITVNLDQNIKGRLTGSGSTRFQIGDDTVTGRYTAVGRIFTSSGRTRLKLTVRLSGADAIAGVTNTFRMTLVEHLDIDPLTGQVSGQASGRAKFSKLVDGPFAKEASGELPEGNDGSWTLTLDLTAGTSGTKPGGNGAIELPNGRILQFSAKGRYSAPDDLTRLTLSGFGTAKGSKLSIRLLGSEAGLTELYGKAFGQSIRY